VDTALTANQNIVYLPTEDADRFIRNVQQSWVPGTTLAVDFAFPAFPSNLGHWTEVLFPMLSALSDGVWAEHVQDQEQQGHRQGHRKEPGKLLPAIARLCRSMLRNSHSTQPFSSRHGCHKLQWSNCTFLNVLMARQWNLILARNACCCKGAGDILHLRKQLMDGSCRR
jgi:hypothetical protein